MNAVLVDTNLLFYAWCVPTADARVAPAKSVLEGHVRAGTACTALQNLSEFSSISLSKARLPARDVARIVRLIVSGFRVVRGTESTVLAALGGVADHGLAFWDACLWAVARENGIATILSEDFQHGRAIEGVRFENPLK